MEYNMEQKPVIKLMGVHKRVSVKDAYERIPKYWDEFMRKHKSTLERLSVAPMYAVCIEEKGSMGEFDYMIAIDQKEDTIPEGFEALEIPSYEWAVFPCKGPMPEALQSVNTKVFTEWLPNNKEYELATGMNIEMYPMGDNASEDYVSEIWVPVKKK